MIYECWLHPSPLCLKCINWKLSVSWCTVRPCDHSYCPTSLINPPLLIVSKHPIHSSSIFSTSPAFHFSTLRSVPYRTSPHFSFNNLPFLGCTISSFSFLRCTHYLLTQRTCSFNVGSGASFRPRLLLGVFSVGGGGVCRGESNKGRERENTCSLWLGRWYWLLNIWRFARCLRRTLCRPTLFVPMSAFWTPA